MATMGFIHSSESDTTKLTTYSTIVPETFTHSIAFGQTGCGKTSSYIYPNLYERLSLGHSILLYDYKGKEHLSLKYLAQKAGRLQDVVEIGKPWGEHINLIHKMDEDALDKFFDNILKHGEDSKYWQNSAKSLGQTLLSVLKGIEDFAIALESVDGISREKIEVSELSSFSYPTTRSLHSLVEVCKTFETLKEFVSSTDSLLETTDILTKRAARYTFAHSGIDKEVRAKILNLLAKKEALKIILKVRKNSLESFGENSNENLTQNIMGSLLSPLLSLSQRKSFNTNSFDIVEALNKAKIVVVNVESLSSSAIESLNNTLLYELSKRTRETNVHPVSVFIDEVQRVVSQNTDLPIDVFREAKVDMFLCTQNSALLKEKLKEEKFEALMGNLTQKFYYASSNDEGLDTELSLKELKSFEYLSSSDDYMYIKSTKALFLERNKLKTVEFEYQKSKKILDNFLYKYRNAKIVIDYDARLYRENKVIAIDLKTDREVVVDSLTKENIEYLEREYKTLCNTISIRETPSIREASSQKEKDEAFY